MLEGFPTLPAGMEGIPASLPSRQSPIPATPPPIPLGQILTSPPRVPEKPTNPMYYVDQYGRSVLEGAKTIPSELGQLARGIGGNIRHAFTPNPQSLGMHDVRKSLGRPADPSPEEVRAYREMEERANQNLMAGASNLWNNPAIEAAEWASIPFGNPMALGKMISKQTGQALAKRRAIRYNFNTRGSTVHSLNKSGKPDYHHGAVDLPEGHDPVLSANAVFDVNQAGLRAFRTGKKRKHPFAAVVGDEVEIPKDLLKDENFEEVFFNPAKHDTWVDANGTPIQGTQEYVLQQGKRMWIYKPKRRYPKGMAIDVLDDDRLSKLVDDIEDSANYRFDENLRRYPLDEDMVSYDDYFKKHKSQDLLESDLDPGFRESLEHNVIQIKDLESRLLDITVPYIRQNPELMTEVFNKSRDLAQKMPSHYGKREVRKLHRELGHVEGRHIRSALDRIDLNKIRSEIAMMEKYAERLNLSAKEIENLMNLRKDADRILRDLSHIYGDGMKGSYREYIRRTAYDILEEIQEKYNTPDLLDVGGARGFYDGVLGVIQQGGLSIEDAQRWAFAKALIDREVPVEISGALYHSGLSRYMKTKKSKMQRGQEQWSDANRTEE